MTAKDLPGYAAGYSQAVHDAHRMALSEFAAIEAKLRQGDLETAFRIAQGIYELRNPVAAAAERILKVVR